MTASRRFRITALAVAGLAALQLAWIVVMVPYFGIDEFDHGLRASSVAAGHWQAGRGSVPSSRGRGDLIVVRADVAAAVGPGCASRPYTGPWNCRPVRTADPGHVLIASAASRYNPSYYALVGTVALPWHGNANLIALRVMTAVLSALFFGLAVWLVLGFARTPWPMAALVLTVLPTTVYSSAVAAPNGVEIFAGIALWACLIALFEGPTRRERTTAYAGASISAIALANTHTLGLMWCGLIGAVVILTYGPRHAARTLRPRRRSEAFALIALAAGAAFELVWVVTTGVNNPENPANSITVSPWPSIVQGLILWPLQTIGAIPLRDNAAPTLTLALFAAALLALLVGAVRRAGLSAHLIRGSLVILALSYLVPAFLTFREFRQTGPIWQGRYAAPFLAGAFLLAGLALDRAPAIRPRSVAVLLASGALALSTAHVVALISMTRTQARLTTLVAATGWTQPSVLLLVGCATVSGACWWTAVRSTAAPVVPEPDGGRTHDRRPVAVLR
jgi:hypothetical protein